MALPAVRVQELCESRGGRPGLPVLMNLTMVSVDVNRVQELCESRGGRPGLPVQMSLTMVSVDVKPTLNHAHALVSLYLIFRPDIRGHEAPHLHHRYPQ